MSRIISCGEAIREGLIEAAKKDDSVIFLAEGVDDPSAVYGTLKGLEKAIQNYYYSPSIKLEEIGENKWNVVNSKGIITSVIVIKKGKRYRFEKR